MKSAGVVAARECLTELTTLLSDANAALESFDDNKIRAVLAHADRLQVALECEGHMRRLLAMPPRPRLQLRLKKALPLGDADMVAHTTMHIKERVPSRWTPSPACDHRRCVCVCCFPATSHPYSRLECIQSP